MKYGKQWITYDNINSCFCSSLPPNEDGMWNEEEVKKAADEVAGFFKM